MSTFLIVIALVLLLVLIFYYCSESLADFFEGIFDSIDFFD